MTRLELLKILVGQARENGFEFRRWFTRYLGLPWQSADTAFTALSQHRQYYALLFSHDFARAFWKAGETMTFRIAALSYQRRMPDGSVATVQRKPFVRRSSRPDAWRYHLRELALAEEPLRYMRRYLRVEEDLSDEDTAATTASPSAAPKAKPAIPPTLALARRAHERRLLAAEVPPKSSSKRTPRLPGSKAKKS